jgi:hypothetical protein
MAISQSMVFDSENTQRFLSPGGQSGITVAGTTAQIFGPIGPAVFGWASFNLQTLSGSTIAGAWKIEVCNDFRQGPGINPEAGLWTDVTACFRVPNATTGAAIAAVTSGASNQWVQFMTASGIPTPLAGAAYRFTLTPTSGTGLARVVANNAPAGAGF